MEGGVKKERRDKSRLYGGRGRKLQVKRGRKEGGKRKRGKVPL